MADKSLRASCQHPVKDLRICDTFPDNWIECGVCGESFVMERVIGYDLPGSTARLLAITRALPGLSSDARPLAEFLAPHITLDYALVVQQGIYKREQAPEADEEPDLKWGH